MHNMAETQAEIDKRVRNGRFADLGTIAAQVAKTEEQLPLPTMENTVIDNVNHPKHYNAHGIECIEAIRATLTDEEFRGYCKGNVLKYTWREQYKNGDEDLRKAEWYLSRLINDIRKHEPTS